MSSNGTRLLAAGIEVTLKDGVPRRLIIDMEALAVIEERIGSLSAYVEGLRRDVRGRMVSSVLAGLEAGLRHLRDPNGEPAFNRKRVAQLMEFDHLTDYVVALDKAWDEGVPMSEEASAEGKASSRARRSPGQSSTGERPSPTDGATASSGG